MSGFSLNLVLRHNRVSIRWYMTKLQKTDRITSFGGIYFVNRLFDQFSLGKVTTRLVCAVLQHNGYQWDEIVKSLFDIYLVAVTIEDITSLMPCLSQAPDSHVPSSDTIGRGHQATGNRQYHIYGQEEIHTHSTPTSFRTTHWWNSTWPWGFSRVVSSWCGLWPSIHSSSGETRCHIPFYKKAFWLFPVWQAGGVIVHVENWDGNTPVKFCQAETLKRLFASLRKHGLFIYRFRADCGPIRKKNRGNHRRAQQSVLSACVKLVRAPIRNLQSWTVGFKPLKSITRKCEVCSPKFNRFMEEKRLSPRHSAHAH